MDSEFVLLYGTNLGMGPTGEKRRESSGILEAPALGGRFSVSFICNHGKPWQMVEGIQLGKFLSQDHLGEGRRKVFHFILRIEMYTLIYRVNSEFI